MPTYLDYDGILAYFQGVDLDDDESEAESSDDYMEFGQIVNPEFSRPDVCAFAFLDRLVPSENHEDLIGGAEHDVIYIGPSIEELAGKVTKEDLIFLSRCGVLYMDEGDCLGMFE